ncbi:TniB family NTP-binding protein [Microbacterium oxydans]|nr:TniB family NTP-binding protein [Microbacterium oxydans]
MNTKQGWTAFVDEILDQPVPMRREELEALSPGDRALNRESRKQFMIRGSVVHTAQFKAIETEILRRLMLNRYKSHGKLGVIVSGEPNIGKTTTITQIARRFERRRRGIGAVGRNAIPVIYVSVPPPAPRS